MRKIIAIFILISNLLYCQDYAVDFDISKFIESGGISKEVYRKINGKLELSEKFEYNKDSALVKLAINKELPGGLALKGINYFLDSKNRITKAEIKISDIYSSPNAYSIQFVAYNYFDSRKVASFYNVNNKIDKKEYFFYNEKKELVENFTVSEDLVLQKRNIYYKKNGYQINESETYTALRYKTITKTKLDKNGFPIYIESEGKMIQSGEKMPKQTTYFQNEVDEKGNLSKVYIIEGKKKILIQEVINKYE